MQKFNNRVKTNSLYAYHITQYFNLFCVFSVCIYIYIAAIAAVLKQNYAHKTDTTLVLLNQNRTHPRASSAHHQCKNAFGHSVLPRMRIINIQSNIKILIDRKQVQYHPTQSQSKFQYPQNASAAQTRK